MEAVNVDFNRLRLIGIAGRSRVRFILEGFDDEQLAVFPARRYLSAIVIAYDSASIVKRIVTLVTFERFLWRG